MIEFAPVHRRRHASRRLARVPCAATRLADFTPVGEDLLDLSPAGALLRTEAALALGDSLLVSFRVPGEDHVIDAPAIVVRHVRGLRASDRGRGVGLRFEKLHPTEIRRLGDGLSRVPPVIPGRRRAVDYASAVRAIGSGILL